MEDKNYVWIWTQTELAGLESSEVTSTKHYSPARLKISVVKKITGQIQKSPHGLRHNMKDMFSSVLQVVRLLMPDRVTNNKFQFFKHPIYFLLCMNEDNFMQNIQTLQHFGLRRFEDLQSWTEMIDFFCI